MKYPFESQTPQRGQAADSRLAIVLCELENYRLRHHHLSLPGGWKTTPG
jgi:hypothetical protein